MSRVERIPRIHWIQLRNLALFFTVSLPLFYREVLMKICNSCRTDEIRFGWITNCEICDRCPHNCLCLKNSKETKQSSVTDASKAVS